MNAPQPITVVVRLFAHAREVAGSASLRLRMAHGDQAGAVWSALPPEVRATLDQGSTRMAVNGAWAHASTPLDDGDEVALIPPVSGG